MSGGLQALGLLGGVAVSGGGCTIDGVIIPSETIMNSGEEWEMESELIWTLDMQEEPFDDNLEQYAGL